jgi:hypothetical protein
VLLGLVVLSGDVVVPLGVGLLGVVGVGVVGVGVVGVLVPLGGVVVPLGGVVVVPPEGLVPPGEGELLGAGVAGVGVPEEGEAGVGSGVSWAKALEDAKPPPTISRVTRGNESLSSLDDFLVINHASLY